MDSLPEVAHELKLWATEIEKMSTPDYRVTHQELTGARDVLNECAAAVQTIRDKIVFEK